MGPLLFIIYINDIIADLECDTLLFADDTCLVATGTDTNLTSQALNRDLEKIFQWSLKWKVAFNPSKSKDMIFTNKLLNNSPPLIFNGTFVDRVNSHKHLGIYLTSNLDWSLHINETCKKAYRKLAVMRSVVQLSRTTLDLLYKLTVRSVIDYGLVVYGTTLKQVDLDRLEKLQYAAAKLVTGALHLTSREKLNSELGWETIKTRIDYLGLCLFHKITKHETRPLITTYMTAQNMRNKNSKLFGQFTKHKNFGVKFCNSFFPYFTNKWNTLPRLLQFSDLVDFKSRLKTRLKPSKQKFYAYGPKLGNKLLTRLRVGRSWLNASRYAVGKHDSPSCLCHERQETTRHYLLSCFLYTVERQNLFNQVKELVPNFCNLSLNAKENTLLYGLPEDKYYSINVQILKHTQQFILKTGRFK